MERKRSPVIRSISYVLLIAMLLSLFPTAFADDCSQEMMRADETQVVTDECTGPECDECAYHQNESIPEGSETPPAEPEVPPETPAVPEIQAADPEASLNVIEVSVTEPESPIETQEEQPVPLQVNFLYDLYGFDFDNLTDEEIYDYFYPLMLQNNDLYMEILTHCSDEQLNRWNAILANWVNTAVPSEPEQPATAETSDPALQGTEDPLSGTGDTVNNVNEDPSSETNQDNSEAQTDDGGCIVIPTTYVINQMFPEEITNAVYLNETEYTSNLLLSDGSQTVENQLLESDEYVLCENYEAAVKYVRQCMVDRVVCIRPKIKVSGAETVVNLFKDAQAHTGNGAEGDYLWYNMAGYSTGGVYQTENGQRYYYGSYSVSYLDNAEQAKKATAKVNELYQSLRLYEGTDYEKIFRIYYWITQNVDYAYSSDENVVYSAYGALCNGKAVCQGYATAFYRLALEAGVDARFVENTEMRHGWNIVKMGTYYYNLDSTWDANAFDWRNFLAGDINALGSFYSQHAANGVIRQKALDGYQISYEYYPCYDTSPEYATWYVDYKNSKGYSKCIDNGNGYCVKCGMKLRFVSTTSIAFDESQIDMECTKTASLKVSMLPENATDKSYSVTYTGPEAGISYDPMTGTVTAYKPGTYTLTATSNNSKHTATCTVNVAPYELLKVQIDNTGTNMVAYADGITVPIEEGGYIHLPDCNVKTVVTVEYNSTDISTSYPKSGSLKVYFIDEDGSGKCTARRDTTFDNCISYGGMGLRSNGKFGIRLMTMMTEQFRYNGVRNGVNGWTFKEYGSCLAWDDDLNGTDLTLKNARSKSIAYSVSQGIDLILAYGRNSITYASPITWTNDEKCIPSLSFRPYVIMTNGTTDIVIYGGTIHRTMGYVAYQNRSNVTPGTEMYDRLWNIIRICGFDK